MPRQIIEKRETEEIAIEEIDKQTALLAHYDTTSLTNRVAFETIVFEEGTQVAAGKKIGKSASAARQRKVINERELRASVISDLT